MHCHQFQASLSLSSSCPHSVSIYLSSIWRWGRLRGRIVDYCAVLNNIRTSVKMCVHVCIVGVCLELGNKARIKATSLERQEQERGREREKGGGGDGQKLSEGETRRGNLSEACLRQ